MWESLVGELMSLVTVPEVYSKLAVIFFGTSLFCGSNLDLFPCMLLYLLYINVVFEFELYEETLNSLKTKSN